jgi:hypothetical protein
MTYTNLPIHQRINAKHNAMFNWTFRSQDLMNRLSKKSLEWCNVMYDPDRMILSKHRQDEPANAGYPDYDSVSIQEQSEKAYKQKYS